MMTPVGRLVLVRATPKNELVAAMSWLTVPALVGPLVGPPIGGFITTYFTWHWIFLINVPIGLIGMWLATRYLPDDVRASVMARSEGHIAIADIPHCAGEQYPRLVLGTNDLALFWRAMPWDHAPGALFLEEAGGRIARIDGRPYRLGDDRPGLLAAASPRLWDEAAERLFG